MRIIPHFSNGTRDLAEGSTIFLILSTRARYKKNTLICESRAEKQTIFDSAIFFFFEGKKFQKIRETNKCYRFSFARLPSPSLSKQRMRLFRIDTIPLFPFFFNPTPAKSNIDKLSYFPDDIYIYIATQTPLRRPRGMTRAGVEGDKRRGRWKLATKGAKEYRRRRFHVTRESVSGGNRLLESHASHHPRPFDSPSSRASRLCVSERQHVAAGGGRRWPIAHGDAGRYTRTRTGHVVALCRHQGGYLHPPSGASVTMRHSCISDNIGESHGS